MQPEVGGVDFETLTLTAVSQCDVYDAYSFVAQCVRYYDASHTLLRT